MQFKSEELRLKDPVASLIPQKLWMNAFYQELNEAYIPVMIEKEEASIFELLDKDPLSSYVNDERLWLAIALSHPHLSPESLHKMGGRFSAATMLKMAIQWGNHEYLHYLINCYQQKACLHSALLDYDCSALLRAIEDAPMEQVLFLLEQLPFSPKNIIPFVGLKALQSAVKGGQLNLFKYFLAQVSEEEAQDLIRKDSYAVFRAAAEAGQLEILEYLVARAPTEVSAMVQSYNYSAFGLAAHGRHLKVLKYLESLAPQEIEAMVEAFDYDAFHLAAFHGDLELLDYLKEKIPEKISTLLQSRDYKAFRNAARAGHLKVLEYLVAVAPEAVGAMIQANDYEAFRGAARAGHLEILKYLIDLAPQDTQAMIQESENEAFNNAALGGHLEILSYLISQAPQLAQSLIQTNNYSAFRWAAKLGQFELLKFLIEQAPQEAEAMIQSYDYAPFINAAENGHLEILKFLAAQAPNEIQSMIEASDYAAFIWAAQNGQLEIMQYLVSQAPELIQTMVEANQYAAFRMAARLGHLEVLKYLIELAPDQTQAMVQSANYSAFVGASIQGHLKILKYLVEQAPQERDAMIRVNEYAAFRFAAEKGYVDILEYLVAQAPHEIQAMIQGYRFEALSWSSRAGHFEVIQFIAAQAPELFQQESRTGRILQVAAQYNHHQVVLYLLEDPLVFAHAEQHSEEYQRYLRPIVDERLAVLRKKKLAFEEANPNGVFNVDAEEALYLFYLLRHLIRRQHAADLDDIHLLLSLPKLKELVPGGTRPNELLRLAVSVNHAAVAGLLLHIPSVRILAEQNEYYRQEMQAGLDLQALAQDSESAMHALTSGEQSRLEAARARYEPQLKEQGVVKVLTELKSLLKERYLLRPAQIEVEEEEEKRILSLPLEWEEFLKLELTEAQKQAALLAYHQQKDHTALRYLSKPNPWMHEQALYVNENEEGKWSTFEEYQPLIALLFLAAKDETSEPIEQFTLETRIEHFISELALIGRAHNWDKSRVKTDSEANPLFDAEGKPLLEEYDDGEGDRPTCYSGVKRRLFQALPGHILFRVLSEDTLKTELRDFVRAHFKTLINESNKKRFKEAWNALVEGSQEGIAVLKELDLSEEQQKELMKILELRYGTQFTADPYFVKRVQDSFVLNQSLADCHFIRFGYAQPELFLEETREQEQSKKPLKAQSSIQLRILSGFIAVLGLIAVALAFTLLNAAALGIAGVILAAMGAAAMLTGLGLFAKSFYKSKPEVLEKLIMEPSV